MSDIPFHDAHNQFDTAAGQLIGMRWATIHRCNNPEHRPDCHCAGTSRTWQPPLYTQIRDDVDGLAGTEGKGKSESRPPLWIDGIDWLKRVDTTITAWTPNMHGGTVARLDDLTRHPFGPDDTPWLTKAAAKLQELAQKGEVLLQGEETRRFDVVAPCPQCGKRTVYRKDSGGDHVRQTALQLTIHGCACIACGTWWDRDHLNFLAEVIGCERKELA